MTREEAFDCGIRCKNMDTETAQRTFYEAYGIQSTNISSPSVDGTSNYNYWCPESDPPSNLMDEFWYGYYSEPRPASLAIPSTMIDREAADLEHFHDLMDRTYR